MLGEVGPGCSGTSRYLVVMGAIGLLGAARRLERLLLT